MVAGKIKPMATAVIAWVWLASNPAYADAAAIPVDPYANVDTIRQLSEQGKIIPMQRLLKKAMPYVHGHIIEAGLELEHGQLLYEIEYVDTVGKVHEVYFNAHDGRLFIPSSSQDDPSDDEKEQKTKAGM